MEDPVITGLGVVTRFGAGVPAMWSRLQEPRPEPAERTDDLRAKVALPLYYSSRNAHGRRFGSASCMAVAASREALLDASLSSVDWKADRVAVVMGTSVGDAWQAENARALGLDEEWRSPLSIASAVAAGIGPCSAALNLSNACAGGGYAMTMGADLIHSGEVDIVIAGGAEAYSRVTVAGFNAMNALASHEPRPFDEKRTGVVLSEGAGVVVMESAAHALARSARVYARLSGTGISCDAGHPTAPDASGDHVVRAMRDALSTARCTSKDIAFVVPHGTGTPLNDVTEYRALHRVFGDQLEELPIFNLKAVLGHVAGGSATVSAVAAALAIHRGSLPPNALIRHPDPECPVFVPSEVTAVTGGSAMINAYAVGGNNVSLILSSADS